MERFKHGRLYALQPFAYMFKDFLDTFSRYKSKWYIVNRDLKLPIAGFRNIYDGIIEFAVNLRQFQTTLALHGLNNVIRGLTQVLATPLLLLRLPLRGILTATFGYKRIEKNSSFQQLVEKGKRLAEKIKNYNHNISLLREKKHFIGAPADYLAKNFPKLTELLTQQILTVDEMNADEERLLKESTTLSFLMERIDKRLDAKYRKALAERKQTSNIEMPADFELLKDIKVDVHKGVICELSTFESHLKIFAPNGKKKRLFAGNDMQTIHKDTTPKLPTLFTKSRHKINNALNVRKEMQENKETQKKETKTVTPV